MNTGYDPEKQHRRSIRLKGYDYSRTGAYFVTICTQNKRPYFEQYPALKEIVNRQWQKMSNRYPDVMLDEFIIMPNHVHGIIMINDNNVGATLAVAQNDGAGTRPAPPRLTEEEIRIVEGEETRRQY